MMEENPHSNSPYGGYHQTLLPDIDRELTQVGPATPGGEYLRRFWHPVAMASGIKDLPLSIRILGEDLVLFRTSRGEIGLVHRHCPHRGASLEFGIVEERGLRCCYHGWLIGPDGSVLETPAESETSQLRRSLFHGAYRTMEYKGLVFAHLGPPDRTPPFPIYDSFDVPGNKLVTFSFRVPCNWVQIGDNGMDPMHTSFLHMIGYPQFGSAWTDLPELEFRETPTGMIYVSVLRVGDNIWVRSNDAILPNLAQTGALWVTGEREHTFSRAAVTRWRVPIDDTATLQIGWRHFNATVDPDGRGDETEVGEELIDFFGQTQDQRSREERQRIPSDYDVVVSQRPIANHRLEHLGSADRGVALLRQLLRRGIRTSGSAPNQPARTDAAIPTYVHDTILRVPKRSDVDDRMLRRRIGREITDIVIESATAAWNDRIAEVRRRVAAQAIHWQ